jgi:hypothetical protein
MLTLIASSSERADRALRILVCGAMLAAVAGVACSTPPSPEPSPKVLVVAMDGVRPDALARANTPTIEALIDAGCYSDSAQCEDLTFSAPNWSTILHGVHRDKHLSLDNEYPETNLDAWPDFFTYLERHDPSLNTYRVITWKEAHEGQPTGADVAIFRDYQTQGDELATEDVVRLLAGDHPEYADDPDAIFIFYSDTDEAGHEFGFHPDVPEYLAAIETVDGYLGRIIAAMEERSTFAEEDWLVVVTSDHGGDLEGTHSGGTPEKRTIPFLVSGSSVIGDAPFPAARNVDVAKTVLAHMGVPIDEAWGLDGHVVGLPEGESRMPPEASAMRLEENLLFNGGGEFDRGFTDLELDQQVSGWEDPGPCGITLVPYGTPGFPAALDPGIEDPGRNLFTVVVVPPPVPNEDGELPEGPACVPMPYLRQSIELSRLADELDNDGIGYMLSVATGGAEDSRNHFQAVARFYDDDGELLSTSEYEPPSGGLAMGSLGLRMGAGPVPVGARRVEVELAAIRTDDFEGTLYADNLFFALLRRLDPAMQPGH